jgi:hypothetical protein
VKTELERFVMKIVQHTECSKEEKEDLFEELMVHLQLSKEHFLEQGLSEDEAEQKAMEQFGEEGEIGSQIQQSLFPYRKEMMLTLAISSILFTIGAYLGQLLINGDAHIGWLLLSMGASSMILFLAVNQVFHLNRKRWMNSLLIVHILVYAAGYLLASNLDHYISVGLSIWDLLNILLAIVLVYRTTLYDFSTHSKMHHTLKRLHAINITAGVLVTAACLFFAWGGLIMIGLHPVILISLSPIFVWIILYIIQIKVSRKNKKLAYGLSAIPYIAILTGLALIYAPALFY